MAPTYELYTYYRSSCSARVRIAAAHKGLSLSPRFIHLLKGEQRNEEYQSVNPSGSVPTLVVTEGGATVAIIQQSIAALEYMEDSRPDCPALLPVGAAERAAVRQLVNIVACDMQPVTNLRVLEAVREGGGAGDEWQRRWLARGLLAYERTLERQSRCGTYSFGDRVTMADVVLAPAVDGALRWGVDLGATPRVLAVYRALQDLDAFRAGAWQAQPDTPAELRSP